ncbi:hypothetical protein F4819DRAFT_190418 [Hypoxylon fuscum]|nr:hypothetical protein F4819DRAFT_190418 [Hypoxylon fuscum]
MAPTSKSSASGPKGTGANPAPDFTVNMNRIQMQLEARLKAARSFLPSRPDLNSTKPNSGSFSALNASANPSAPQSLSREDSERAAARRKEEDAEFAEERGLDPNAGIGLSRSSAAAGANGSENARDRDTAQLRGRLLGKRGRAGADGSAQKWQRKEESSDDEAGRSGLGRTKRNGKRSRAEMEVDNVRDRGDLTETNVSPDITMPEARDTGAETDPANGPEKEAENLTIRAMDEGESSQPNAEGSSKKKRKKKKKKKAKDKIDEN